MYSQVVDTTTFHYLINLVVNAGLNLHLISVVTVYLYGSLNNDIYMKIPEGLKVPKASDSSSQEQYSVKLNKFIYGLKQLGRMRYNRLNEYLLKEGYKNDSICPCIFVKRSGSEVAIIVVYVDDINIIRTSEELQKAEERISNQGLGENKILS